MRYRALSPEGDHQFGRSGIFLVDSPQAVAQAALTRLFLWSGEWFLDKDEGVDYQGKIIGYGTHGTRDMEIKARILGTPGVLSLTKYSSSLGADRRFVVEAILETSYGAASLSAVV